MTGSDDMVSNNPYAPPTTVVADAAPTVALVRPRIVTIAAALLWVSMLIGMPVALWRISTFGGATPATYFGMFLVVYAFLLSLSYWLFGSMRNGKNWARITIFVITALYIVMQPLALQVTLAGPLPEAVVRISQLLFWIAASALLLAPASRDWYRALKER
jgi:peptidoglycan/LPS O-acetylase OafA/YrhL